MNELPNVSSTVFLAPQPTSAESKSAVARIAQEALTHVSKASKKKLAGAKNLPSICTSANFPTLDAEERKLFLNLFPRWPLSSTFNLLDLFMIDFIAQWDEILKLATYEPALLKLLKEFQNEHKLFIHIHSVYMYLLGHLSPYSHLTESLDSCLFKTPKYLIKFLEEYAVEMLKTSESISSLISSKQQGKSKGIKEFLARKSQPLIESVEVLGRKAKLVAKFFQVKDPAELLISRNLSKTAEGAQLDAPSDKWQEATFYFFSLWQTFCSKNFHPFEKLINQIKKIVQKKILAPKEAILFNNLYKSCSFAFSVTERDCIGYLERTQNDPTFTYEKFCQENPTIIDSQNLPSTNKTQLLANFLHTKLYLELLDKWVNNLNHTLSHRFLSPLGAEFYKPPKFYIERLIGNLAHALKKSQIGPKNFDDPFLDLFSSKLFDSLLLPSEELEKALSNICLTTMAVRIKAASNVHPFRLSLFQNIFNPFFAVFPILDKTIGPQIEAIHARNLELIRVAKEQGRLKGWKAEELKTMLTQQLYESSSRLASLIMVVADARILLMLNNAKDIIHLLPSSFVRFLELDGYDEIFVEPLPSVPESAASAIVEKVAPAVLKPIVQLQQKKEVDLPTKRDFLEETKRKAILRMLDTLGLKFERYGKGSHEIYRHPTTGHSAVVPQDVADDGTRKSIWEQATGGDDEKDEKISPSY